MGYFIASKDTLYIKFDLFTQAIVQNDSVSIEYYPESNLDLGTFAIDDSNSNFSLIADIVNIDLHHVEPYSLPISKDVGIFNETIELTSDFNPNNKKTITLQVEYFNSNNPNTPLPEPEPTYNLKYWLEFTNQNAISHRLEILQLGFEGASTQIYGNFVHQYTKKKDIHDTIVPSNLSINLEANTTLTLNDLYSEEEQTFLVKAYRNSQLIFIGFIKPDGIYEDWVSDRWLLSIDCYDGLNILKDLSFVKSDGMFFRSNMSELNAIYYSLIRTKLDLPINVCIDVFNNEFNSAIYNSILEQVYINTERYYQDVEKEKIMDCNEVVSSILSTYNASIIQMNGEWFIYRPIDVKNGMTFKRYVNGIFENEISFEAGKTIGSHINGLENFDAIHCNANQRKTISPSCQAFRVNYKYGTVASILENTNLKLGEGLDIEGFVVDNTLGNVYRNASGYGIWAWTIPAATSSFSFVKLIETNPIYVANGDTVDFTIKFESTGYATGLKISIETPNYILYQKKGWQLKTASISDDTPYLNWYNSNAGYLSVGEGIMVVNLTTTFPEEGDFILKIANDEVEGLPVGAEQGKFILHMVEIKPNKNTNLAIQGEYHDAQFKTRKSTKTSKDLVVYNGDTLSEIYYGTLLDSLGGYLNAKWYRFGFTEERELLSICAEDRLRSAPRPMIEFEGDIMGYIPFLSFISINNITGNFQPIEYTYNPISDTIKLVNREFSNVPLDVTTFSVEKSYDYGNVTKVTIKS